MKKQKRNLDFNIGKIETREEDGKKLIRGYASVFDTPSNSKIWGVREIIGRSAFTKTLKESRDIKALCNHDKAQVLGSTRAETLKLEVDEKGLYFEIDPAEELRSYEKDLLISLERGDVSGCSFGFYIVKFHEEHRGDENYVIIDELKLLEISVVTFPAYDETSVDHRGDDFNPVENFINHLKKKNSENATILGNEERDEILELLNKKEKPEPVDNHSDDQPAEATEEEKRNLSLRLRLAQQISV